MPRLTDKNILSAAISRKRPPWISPALSFFCPGLGQLYNADGPKGIVLTMVFLLSVLFIPVYCVAYGNTISIKVILFITVAAVCFWGYGITDAAIVARRNREIALRRYTIAPVYAAYVAVSLSIFAGAFFALLACISLTRIDGDSMAPALQDGEWVLVNRYEGKRVRASDVAIYNSDKGGRIGRIIAIPGETVVKNGASFLINNEALTLGVFSPADISRYGLVNSEELYFEVRDNVRYPIRASSSAVARRLRGTAWIRLKEDQLFVADDDRIDSAGEGIIRRSDIAGRVEGIVFSLRPGRIFIKPRFPAAE